MNMTEQDWENFFKEYKPSLDDIGEPTGPDYPDGPEFQGYEKRITGNVKVTVKQDARNQLFDYIRIEKGTPKAYFFVTHETLGEIHGFWCPKAAIVKDTGNQVEIQHWCKIKIIQFV